MRTTGYAIFGAFAVSVELPDVEENRVATELLNAAQRIWEQDFAIGLVADVPEPVRLALETHYITRRSTWVAVDDESRVVGIYSGPGHPRHRGQMGLTPAQWKLMQQRYGKDRDGIVDDGTKWCRPPRPDD